VVTFKARTNGPQDMGASIVVTGIGLATSLGFGVPENWRRLIAGDSGITVLDPGRFAFPLDLPIRLGAQVPREKLAEAVRTAVPRSVWNTSADVCHAWLLVALEALAMAGLPGAVQESSVEKGASNPAAGDGSPRVGIFVGNGAGAATFTEQEYANVYTAEKAVHRDISRMAVPKYMASSLAGQLSILIGARGPAVTVNTACSSGATALVLALDALRLGRIDRAVVGGADLPLTGAVLKGFANLSALSPRHDRGGAACRPFDAGRDGFVLGEGAACLVLESSVVASARGATPLARIAGGASASEAHNLLAPREDGSAMAACMQEALVDAGVAPDDVRHVYTHGTGTQYNDRCEARALQTVLPHQPTVSATKAMVGHTLGAAGAIDAVLAVRGIGSGEVVPCRNLETPDPECPVSLARESRLTSESSTNRTAFLVNSFAFGGHNTCVVVTPA
jgi:3-oxoacyl-[acyl-carrier-protein] synthase II